MTAKLQQWQRERDGPARGSAPRTNLIHPPASPPLPGQPAQSVLDRGGNLPRRSEAEAGAQRRHRFRPHRAYSNHHETPPAPFVIRHYFCKCPYFTRIDRILPDFTCFFKRKPSPTESNPVKPCLLGWRQLVATTFPAARRPTSTPPHHPIRHSSFVICPSASVSKNLCFICAAMPTFGSVAQ